MEWPDPITDQNIDALILNGDIVLTNEVSDLAFEEPTFDEVPIGGCTPDRQVVVSRTITGNDRIIASNLEGSPAVEVPYYERRRWDEILQKQGQLAFGAVYCDGSFLPFLDENGNFLQVSASAWVTYEDGAGGNGTLQREMISFSLEFAGDPLGLYNYPTVKIAI